MFKQPTLNHPAWKLAGMAYCNYFYPPEYWLKLTGVDPRQWPEWFEVRKSGLVGCTPAFDKAYDTHIAESRANWLSLGVRCS